jgi:hypothetical protein
MQWRSSGNREVAHWLKAASLPYSSRDTLVQSACIPSYSLIVLPLKESSPHRANAYQEAWRVVQQGDTGADPATESTSTESTSTDPKRGR